MLSDQLVLPFSAAGVFLLACLSPGPVWAIITTAALEGSRRAAIIAGLGVATATLIWASVTMLGFGVLVANIFWLHAAVKLIGAAYLIWLGVKNLRSGWSNRKGRYIVESSSQMMSPREAYQAGFVASMTNPKAAAFFGSVFVLVLPPYVPVQTQVATVLMVATASALWHCGLGLVLSTASIQQTYLRAKPKVDLAIGLILIALGLRLALS